MSHCAIKIPNDTLKVCCPGQLMHPTIYCSIYFRNVTYVHLKQTNVQGNFTYMATELVGCSALHIASYKLFSQHELCILNRLVVRIAFMKAIIVMYIDTYCYRL